MHNFSFTPAQQHCLENYFSTRKLSIDISFLQGYLYATCIDPNGIEAQQWLKVLTNADPALDESVVFALMALHHEISEQVYETGFTLPWHADTPLPEKINWAEGFLMAATPFYEQLMSSPLADDIKQALQVSTEQLGLFALGEHQLTLYCEKIGQSLEEFQVTQAQLADEFAGSYAELVEVAAVKSGLFE
ncbi:hypothetical protein EAG18_17895 [Pseudoalteromonas sp. J010]|uniref:UPF0149 family protein n=1 Tax=Pseudoalteromonas sp. J010 TaxID=998465 RepID=UPI000F64D6F9|nr:UPF0149 family protein [Pseudoalteromonas sp. J010]RRS07242.1 hypothetical protein EAG18_17895 [Pseudoalteromonas sp. J010]